MADPEAIVTNILKGQRSLPGERALLVAITGIDGSGKGYATERIAAALRTTAGLHVEAIHVDGWLRLPHERFDALHSAQHFYEHAIRFDDLFARLVFPLRDQRSVRLTADRAEETAGAFSPHLYAFDGVDVILLEGIFLLKRAFQDYYDQSYWIECSFETALERAIARAQEGLSPADTVRAYRMTYFPAQRIHLQRDRPKAAATLVVNNDPRLGEVRWST